MKKSKECTYRELIRFIIVGVGNTLLGTGLMFAFYRFFHMGYWLSSAGSYLIASIVSFFLNKYFTFQSENSVADAGIKFGINIAICYIIAYLLAQPIVEIGLMKLNILLSASSVEQIAMLIGMCIFTALNYFGQKYFVFNKDKGKNT